AFGRWIDRRCADADGTCHAHDAWLRSLRPTVLVIQNGVTIDCDRDTRADEPRQHEQARVECLGRLWELEERRHNGPAGEQGRLADYIPEQPRNADSWKLYVDLLGPLVTVVNVSGAGANGRRAEALLKRATAGFPGCGDANSQPGCEVVQLAQRADGILYPLG